MNATHALPCRLSRDSVDVLDTRVRNMFWPHYMDVRVVEQRSVVLESVKCGFVEKISLTKTEQSRW